MLSVPRITVFLLVMAVLPWAIDSTRTLWNPYLTKTIGRKTVADVVTSMDAEVGRRIRPKFGQAGVKYPPEGFALVAYKDAKVLQLWAGSKNHMSRVTEYPWTAYSGSLGPKLAEGDRQIPEGLYDLVGLNPNSAYHLSIKIGYPNSFDKEMASRENRHNLGGDIFIHGKASSIGCIAIGDEAIEELFYLTAKVGFSQGKIIISPTRRYHLMTIENKTRPWIAKLYKDISIALEPFDL